MQKELRGMAQHICSGEHEGWLEEEEEEEEER
jgi:hypothetical protein